MKIQERFVEQIAGRQSMASWSRQTLFDLISDPC